MYMTWDLFKNAGNRALRTFCQTAVVLLGQGALLQDINWLYVGSASLMAAIVTLVLTLVNTIPDPESMNFWMATGARAFRTFLEASTAFMTSAVLLENVDWLNMLSAAGLATIISILTSLAFGLPEAKATRAELLEEISEVDEIPEIQE